MKNHKFTQMNLDINKYLHDNKKQLPYFKNNHYYGIYKTTKFDRKLLTDCQESYLEYLLIKDNSNKQIKELIKQIKNG